MQGKEYFQNRRIADKISLVLKVVFVILAINNILFAALMITFGHLVFLIIPVLGLIIMPILGQQMVKALTDNILEPLEQIENAAEAMAHGNLDIDVTYEAEDELGKLAQSFRNTAASLKEVVEDIDQLLTEFAKGNFDAKSGNIEVYRGNFSEILSKLEETEKGLSQTISNVQESSNQVSAGADQLAQSAQGLAEGATDQAAALEELTSSVNEVAENVAENTKSTDRVHDQAKEVAIKADSGTAKMKELIESMKHISDTTNDIQAVIGKIESIASQTNLLSLNASIEAARAGEAGKGFAVVADEIRGLADSSRETANRIQQINSVVVAAVNNLSGNANELVGYIQNAILPEFEAFVESGVKYRDNASYIENAMQEFTAKTDMLKKNIDEIALSISAITTAVDEGAEGINGAAKSTQNLVEDIVNISDKMNENKVIAQTLQKSTHVFANF